jgi:benzoyl-CoA reductase/2-hydroxyglutaryl-CoA dehydratase subunit BcrC/BadD/HgdB
MEENKIFRDETERLADKYLSHDDMIDGIERLTKTRERVNNIIHVNFKPEA